MGRLALYALSACCLAFAGQVQAQASDEASAKKSIVQNGAATLVNVARGGVITPSVITGFIQQGLQLKQSNELERFKQAVGQGPFAGLGTPLAVLAVGGAETGTASVEAAADAGRGVARAVQGQAALGGLSLTPQGVIGAATGIVFAQKAVNSIKAAQKVAKANQGGIQAALAAARIVPQPDRAWEARAMMVALQDGPGTSYGWKNNETGGEGSITIREAAKEEDISLVGMARAEGRMDYTEADALKEVSDPNYPQFIRMPLVCRNIERTYKSPAGETREHTQLACKDYQFGWFVFE